MWGQTLTLLGGGAGTKFQTVDTGMGQFEIKCNLVGGRSPVRRERS